MDVPDPEGTVVRIVWMNPALPPFVGVASDKNGTAQPYFAPRG